MQALEGLGLRAIFRAEIHLVCAVAHLKHKTHFPQSRTPRNELPHTIAVLRTYIKDRGELSK